MRLTKLNSCSAIFHFSKRSISDLFSRTAAISTNKNDRNQVEKHKRTFRTFVVVSWLYALDWIGTSCGLPRFLFPLPGESESRNTLSLFCNFSENGAADALNRTGKLRRATAGVRYEFFNKTDWFYSFLKCVFYITWHVA